MFEKIEIQKPELTNGQDTNIDFSKLFKDSIIDLNKKYSRPPLA
jgi:hypothetical protein